LKTTKTTITTMQTQRVKYKEVHLLPHQAAALRSKSRFTGLIGGTGGGKTWLIPWWLFAEIEKHPRDEYIVVAPTYKLLTRTTVPIIRDAYRDTDLEGEYRPSYNVYLLPTGGKIWFGTADRPESLEAGQYRAACLDEAGQMKYMAWVAIQARLGMKEGRALLTTTPYGLNWLYHEFYLRWKKGDPNYDVINFSSIDNPYYPAREFERAARDLSESLFAMRYKGQFRKMEGLVYPDFDSNNIAEEEFEIPDDWLRLGGTDFGFNNPHANLKGALSSDDVLYIYDELYVSHMLLKDISKYMKDITYFGDPSGKREIEELRSMGIDIHSGDNDIQKGIEAVNARIRTNRLKVFKSKCPNLLDEIETYHYQTGTEKPYKENDHAVDALRQLVVALDKRRHRIGRVHFIGLDRAQEKEKESEQKRKEVTHVRKGKVYCPW